jgi:hypothetical protein
MNKPLATFITAAVLGGASSIALAELNEPGFYVGGAVGSVSIDESDFDDNSDVNQLYAGVRFNPVLGLEVSRMDFGDYGGDAVSADTDGYGLALTGHLPFNDRFALYGKVGQFWWDTDTEVLGFRQSFDGEEPFVGVGALLSLSEHLNLDISYQRMDVDLEEDEIGPIGDLDLDSEVNIASVGLRLGF